MVNYLGPYSLTNANHHNGKLLGGMNRRIHIPAMRFLLHGGGGSCSRRRLPPAPQQEEPTAPVLVRPTDTRGPTGIPGRGPGLRPSGPSAGRPVSDRDRLPSLICQPPQRQSIWGSERTRCGRCCCCVGPAESHVTGARGARGLQLLRTGVIGSVGPGRQWRWSGAGPVRAVHRVGLEERATLHVRRTDMLPCYVPASPRAHDKNIKKSRRSFVTLRVHAYEEGQ